MKILVLLTDAFGGAGGIALYNRDLLTALCSHPDCERVVAIPRLISNQVGPLPDKLTYITEGVGSKRRYVLTVLQAAIQYKPFDCIVCGHINLLSIAFLLRILHKVPLLLEIYGVDAWAPTKSRLSNFFAAKIHYAVSISDVTRKRFLNWSRLSKNKILLLPNAIHAELYGTAVRSSQLVKRYNLYNKKVLMTLGRMSASEQYKGFDEIIEILPELTKTIPDIIYLAVGDGDDRQRLRIKADDLGISDHVIFTGFVAEEEKADHYGLADVFVMPSQGEGFGFVLLEAMACGIPVIASNSDGTREAVRDGKLGLLVDPRNPAQLKGAILKTLNKPKVIPEGLEYYSFNNFTLRLHNIIDQVIGIQR